ncbi:MAG: hypothetical protein ACE5FM_03155 [Methyloligellaceae bacterium]
MSFAVNIAATAAAANQAQVQMALAAKLAKMNASNEQSVVQLIEAANASLQEVVQSALASGVGANIDISA